MYKKFHFFIDQKIIIENKFLFLAKRKIANTKIIKIEAKDIENIGTNIRNDSTLRWRWMRTKISDDTPKIVSENFLKTKMFYFWN